MMSLSKAALFLSAVLSIASSQVTQDQANKSAAFKERFLKSSNECAGQYGTTAAEMVQQFLRNDEDQSKASCYLYCMMEKYKLMNPKGRYLNENFKRFMDTMPQSAFKSSIQSSVGNCLKEDSEDRCMKAYRFTKCFYKKGAGKVAPK